MFHICWTIWAWKYIIDTDIVHESFIYKIIFQL